MMQADAKEKKTPTNHPHSVGGGILKKEVCETKQITNARDFYSKLDAKEKLPPSNGAPAIARWGRVMKRGCE
jgi:hypothetical protein